MSIGEDAGGAAEATAQMNIRRANLVVTTSLLEYDMFPHRWLPDSTADFSKVPVIKYEIQAAALGTEFGYRRAHVPGLMAPHIPRMPR
jgi:hypothetical protein